jgi:hypothetical protein
MLVVVEAAVTKVAAMVEPVAVDQDLALVVALDHNQ